jgi:hypothetical protein
MGVFNRRSNVPPAQRLRVVQGSGYTIAPRQDQPTLGPRSLPFSTHRNLTAAAQLVDISTSEGRTSYAKRRATAQGWQDEAWLYSDAIGEIGYAFTVVANALSRVRLYTAQVVDPASLPTPADPDNQTGQASIEVLERLSSAFGGIPGLLRDAAMCLQISGECLLVQRPANPFADPPQLESWDIRSADEMQLTPDGRWVIVPREDGDKSSGIVLPKNAYVARIWRPHARFSDSSTSSMRPVLDLCAELMLLNKTFRATARSRLNSGMLYLPDGLSVAAQPDADAFASTEDELEDPDADSAGTFPASAFDVAEQSDTDEFEEALLEAMTTPIADEESAAAVVPLLVRGPADLGEKIRYIQFERSFDPSLAERAQHVLDRIMQGLDVPKEIVKGLSALKFSTAQIVDTQLYQAHVEPLALLICDALTTVYLRPALRSLGLPEDEVQKHVIWYDPSEVTTRPNRAEDADKGYTEHLISGSAWRRAHNFTDDDAPTSTELAVRLLIEKAQLTPELAESLLSVVAPEIMQAVRDASQAANPAPLPSDVSDALDGGTPPPPEEPPGDSGGAPPAPPAPPAPTSPPAAPSTPPAPAPVEAFPGEENLV